MNPHMRLLRLLLPGLLPTLLSSAQPVRVARDWRQFPPVVEVDTAADIFAMGDVHGDYDRLVVLLAGAGVLAGIPPAPDRPAWAAGSSALVFTGDLIDKGPNGLAVIALLRALPDAAAAAGGRVIVLMGNHEAEFLADPGAAKGREFAAELSRAGIQPRAVAACANDVGRFLCGLPFAARVNDWFFSHAGNTDGRTLAGLAGDLRAGIDRDGFASAQLTGPNSLIEARIGEKGPGGRSWFEQGGSRLPPDLLLAEFTRQLGVRHIVEGHHRAAARFPGNAVRRPGEMFNWRGELFLIDTGMSREIGDSAGALLHVRTGRRQAVAVCAGGRETLLWGATRPGQTAKAPPCR